MPFNPHLRIQNDKDPTAKLFWHITLKIHLINPENKLKISFLPGSSQVHLYSIDSTVQNIFDSLIDAVGDLFGDSTDQYTDLVIGKYLYLVIFSDHTLQFLHDQFLF